MPVEAGRAPSAGPRRAAAAAVEIPVAQHVAHAAGGERRRSPAGGCGRGSASARRRRASTRARRRASTSIATCSRGLAPLAFGAHARAPIARRSASGRAQEVALPGRVARRLRGSAGRRRRRCTARRRATSSTRSPNATTTVGSASARHAAGIEQSRRRRRKSRLPAMKPTVRCGGGVASTSAQRASKPARRSVVADPDLEQVAEDEAPRRRACGAGSAAQASKVRGVSSARCRSQMKSIARQCGGRDERPRADLRARTATAPRPSSRQETTVARMIVTSSSGTSSWPPLRPVCTFSIASTTSLPGDDLAEHRVAPALRRLATCSSGSRCRRR